MISMAPSSRSGRPETLALRFRNASSAFQRAFDVTKDGRFLGLIEAGMVKGSGALTSEAFVVLGDA